MHLQDRKTKLEENSLGRRLTAFHASQRSWSKLSNSRGAEKILLLLRPNCCCRSLPRSLTTKKWGCFLRVFCWEPTEGKEKKIVSLSHGRRKEWKCLVDENDWVRDRSGGGKGSNVMERKWFVDQSLLAHIAKILFCCVVWGKELRMQ